MCFGLGFKYFFFDPKKSELFLLKSKIKKNHCDILCLWALFFNKLWQMYIFGHFPLSSAPNLCNHSTNNPYSAKPYFSASPRGQRTIIYCCLVFIINNNTQKANNSSNNGRCRWFSGFFFVQKKMIYFKP